MVLLKPHWQLCLRHGPTPARAGAGRPDASKLGILSKGCATLSVEAVADTWKCHSIPSRGLHDNLNHRRLNMKISFFSKAFAPCLGIVLLFSAPWLPPLIVGGMVWHVRAFGKATKLQILRDQNWGQKTKQKKTTPKGNKQFPH